MTVPFYLRLILLGLASFFVIHLALGAMVGLLASRIAHWARRLSATTAATLLLAVRLMPTIVAFVFVTVFLLPAYAWVEGSEPPESVGIPFLATALIGAMVCIRPLRKGWLALRESGRYYRMCESVGKPATLPGLSTPVLMIDNPSPLLLVVGIFRPRLVVSSAALEALPAEQLNLALKHEQAHQRSRDNLKRLLLLLAPDLVPGYSPLRLLDREWTRVTEWAADDWAVQGSSERSLALASALVRFLRAGSCAELNPLMIPLLGGASDLSPRVDRLLRANSSISTRGSAGAAIASLLLASALIASTLVWYSGSRESVHTLLEYFHGNTDTARPQ